MPPRQIQQALCILAALGVSLIVGYRAGFDSGYRSASVTTGPGLPGIDSPSRQPVTASVPQTDAQVAPSSFADGAFDAAPMTPTALTGIHADIPEAIVPELFVALVGVCILMG